MVWLGVEKAKAIIHGDHSLSFDQLRWYSNAVMRYNPGSYVNIDYNANRTFLKEKYKGQLLSATMKDESNETTTNWSWFLDELGKVVDGKRQITFILDRNLGLLEAMPKVFLLAHHDYCLQHLKNNLKDQMKGIDNGFRDHLVSSLGNCTCEPTMVGFHEKLEKLKEAGKQRAHNFFKDLAPEHWANSYFRGMRYGEMTSNAAESFNNWIKEARNLPITQMVDTIRTQLIRQMSARRDQETSGMRSKSDILDISDKSGRQWRVT
ncbi:uncharacterized protein LOC114294850 [Camellia sinensis]|uniref:uncharacterized protein LOC114294850 n=1 Tax=Camellia sinensis TaxID=4442 RepID=UPI00103598A7|nr:uncharacterized protein LOC114294850 [Camellia sinensis]